MFLQCFIVYVRKIHIVKFHTAKLFKLFLNAAAHFQGYLNYLFQLFFCEFIVRIHQLQIAVYHSANGNGITLIQIFSKTEIMIERITILLFTKLTDKFCKIVADETVIVSEMLRSEFWYLPTRKITVYPVQECSISPHFRRKRVKKTGGFQQDVNALIYITYEYH